jgi:hypothetical protein
MIPEVPDQVAGFNAWAADQTVAPGEPILDKPHRRAVGTVETAYQGVAFKAGISPYRIYLLQKLHDAFDSLEDASKARAQAWFDEAGLAPVLDARPAHRVSRKDNLEVWAG